MVESIAAHVKRIGKEANPFSLRHDVRYYERLQRTLGHHQVSRRSQLESMLETYNWLTANQLSTDHLSTRMK